MDFYERRLQLSQGTSKETRSSKSVHIHRPWREHLFGNLELFGLFLIDQIVGLASFAVMVGVAWAFHQCAEVGKQFGNMPLIAFKALEYFSLALSVLLLVCFEISKCFNLLAAVFSSTSFPVPQPVVNMDDPAIKYQPQHLSEPNEAERS